MQVMTLIRIAFLASFMLLAACGGERQSRVEAGNLEGVLHIGNGTEPQALDPHIVTGVPENHIVSALFEGLVTKNPYTLEIEPGVAERWEISDDGRTYTFHLRDNARWSNGHPLSAEDFRWSWQRALNPALGSLYNYMYYPIVNAEAYANGHLDDFSEVGVRVLDELTLQVELQEPTPYMLQIFDHASTFPVHRATLENFGDPADRLSPWARAGNLVGNGPFALSEWRINSHVRVEKNQHYWDAGRVRLNAIVYYPTENTTTEERMFRDEQLHYTSTVPIDRIAVYQETSPELLVSEDYLGTYYYLLNTTREPLQDVRVRKALAMSIDRELLTETVLEGTVSPAYALTPPGTLGYEPPQTFTYDPEQARALMAEAGYPGGEGFPGFELLYNTQEGHRMIAEAIQEMWRETLGIQVSLMNQEWRVYLDTQENMNYDVSRRGWIGDYIDPNSFLDMMITDGGNNKTGFSSARYDELILREAPREQDQARRFAIYEEAERLMLEEMPIIPIYTYRRNNLRHPAVQGLPANIMGYYNWRYVWLEDADMELAPELEN